MIPLKKTILERKETMHSGRNGWKHWTLSFWYSLMLIQTENVNCDLQSLNHDVEIKIKEAEETSFIDRLIQEIRFVSICFHINKQLNPYLFIFKQKHRVSAFITSVNEFFKERIQVWWFQRSLKPAVCESQELLLRFPVFHSNKWNEPLLFCCWEFIRTPRGKVALIKNN